MNITWWPWIASLLCAAVLIAALSMRSDVPSRETARLTHHDVAREMEIRAPGQVEPARRAAHLVPEVAGRVTEIVVGGGDWVAKGDLLIRLDDSDYRHQLAAANAELHAAQAELQRLQNGARQVDIRAAEAERQAVWAQLEQAEKTWKRHESLANSGTISPQTLERSWSEVGVLRAKLAAASAAAQRLTMGAREEDVARAAARVEAAQAGRDHARVQVSRVELRAPFAGEVLELNVQLGELVRPLQSLPLVVLADTSQLRICAWVEELDAASIELKMRTHFTVDGLPQQTFSGTVTELSPRMQRKKIRTDRPEDLHDMRTRQVWIAVDDVSQLVPGMHVDVRFSPANDPHDNGKPMPVR